MAEIIAEICQNHRGDRGLLKEMIWSAAESGADIVKGQIIFSEDLTYRERFEKGRQEGDKKSAIKRPYRPEYERLSKLDLTEDDYHFFVEQANKAKVQPMFTIFSRKRIPLAKKTGVKLIKVASYDCASFPFLKELKDNFEKLYISTGATFDEEIRQAASLLADADFVFLHCVTRYPTPLSELNLSRLGYLRQFTDSVGFSDHSLVKRDALKASISALASGAQIIERHFTILDKAETKDGPVSLNPAELRELSNVANLPLQQVQELAKEIPEYAAMTGSESPGLSDEELLNRDYYRGRFASFVPSAPKKPSYNWEEDKAAYEQ